jgi:four helix bundle protein
MRSHEESDAYQLAAEARRRVQQLVKRPAFSRDFDLARQISRSSHSACANMAEGFSRFHDGDHARFLEVARASLSETIEHLTAAVERGYLERTEMQAVAVLCRRSRGACTQWILYLDSKKPR